MDASGTSISMHCLGIVSCIGSLSVIYVYLRDKELGQKLYNTVIFNIAVCDLFSGIGAGVGLVRDRSWLCWMQAVLTNVFPIAGVFWTTVIAYLLYSVVSSRETVKVLSTKLHALCWGLPVVLTLLPLTTNRYGTLHDQEYGWCFVAESKRSPKWTLTFWIIVSFYIWIWASMVLYTVLYVYIAHQGPYLTNPMMQSALRNIRFYPLSVIGCWIIPTFYDIVESLSVTNRPYHRDIIYNISYLSPLFQGTLTAMIFFSTNEEARYAFVKNLFDGYKLRKWSNSRLSEDGDASVKVTISKDADPPSISVLPDSHGPSSNSQTFNNIEMCSHDDTVDETRNPMGIAQS